MKMIAVGMKPAAKAGQAIGASKIRLHNTGNERNRSKAAPFQIRP
jgi:hypothetical protein